MNDTNRCGSNRYVSERYNERRCNNERFGECREKSCGCHNHEMNGHCCGWRLAPVRPCRPTSCRPVKCGCECDDMPQNCSCGIRPNHCQPRPCPPRPRPCPPRPCHPSRPCWGPMPYDARMNDYDDYGSYGDMDYMADEYWDVDYANGMKKNLDDVDDKVKESKE